MKQVEAFEHVYMTQLKECVIQKTCRLAFDIDPDFTGIAGIVRFIDRQWPYVVIDNETTFYFGVQVGEPEYWNASRTIHHALWCDYVIAVDIEKNLRDSDNEEETYTVILEVL